MTKIKKEITINAPVDKVFNYFSVPTNMIEIWPSFLEANDVEQLPGGGNKFNYVYKMEESTLRELVKILNICPISM